MNKEETKRRLNCLEADCKNLGTEISILKATLAEDEKLKLRHGDFGYCDEPCYPRIVLDENKLASGHHVFDRNKTDEPTVILGNVFDLMKGWSEPFEHWHSEKGRNYDTDTDLTIVIDTNDCRPDKIWIGTCGNSAWYPRKDAEEIHNALGHAIAELKRKENK